MYKFRYIIAHSADESKFKEIDSLLNENLPRFEKIRQIDESGTRVTFLADKKEVLCLVLDKNSGCVELMSNEKYDFLCCYNAEKIHTDISAGFSKGELAGFQIAFLLLDLFIGFLNSDSFSLGFYGGFDGLFDTPLRNFLMGLPFAAIYFFSYRYFRREGISPLFARFIQLGGAATIAVCVIPLIIMPFALILIFLMCAVNIVIYAMVTAMLFEFIVSKLIQRNDI